MSYAKHRIDTDNWLDEPKKKYNLYINRGYDESQIFDSFKG